MEEHTLLIMKTELFPSPVIKYHLELSSEVKDKIVRLYEKEKFNNKRPFILGPTEEVKELLEEYSSSIEEFVDEVKPNGRATITDVSLVVLGSGDSVPRDCTLPGHFTAVHYISFDSDRHKADIYYHPAFDVLRCLGSHDDLASGIWVQEGDLIFYPSYLHTSSPEHTASEERITLTFTFMIDAGRESDNQEPSE